jgi:hypothetical protein
MHTLIRAHGAVAYREALFADETPLRRDGGDAARGIEG